MADQSQEALQGINAALKRAQARKKRKATMAVASAIMLIAIIAVFFLLSVQPPQPVNLCSNGLQDQGEEGIDCGGQCPEQCLPVEPPPEEYIDTAYVLPTSVSDLAIDSANGKIYVLDEMRHRIMVFDNEFNHIKNFGETRQATPDGGWNYQSGGTGNDQLVFPASIYIANNKIYVLDRVPRIQVFSKSLEYEKTLFFSAEAIQKLPKLPDTPNVDGGKTSMVVSDSGKIYVSDEVSNAIAVFDPNLGLIKAISSADPGNPNIPRQIALGPNGNVFVADSGNGRIQVYDQELNFVKSITTGLLMPTGIALSDSRIFVLDAADSKLKALDLDGNPVKEIGGLGTAKGQFYNPTVVKIDSQGSLFVAEEGNARIQVFDGQLNLAKSIEGLSREFKVSFTPFFPAISPNGDIAISDPINSKVFILGPDFKLKQAIGGKGFENGKFNTPKGLAFGPDGKLFVSDAGNRRIQIFSSDYVYLKTITSDELIWPLAISVSEQGKIFVVDDKYKKILIFDQQGKKTGEIGEKQGITLPLGVLAQAGKIYITDDLGQTIEIFDYSLKKLKSVSGIDEALGINTEFNESLAISGGMLLMCDNRNRKVDAYNLSTGKFSSFGSFGNALQELSILELAATKDLIAVTDMEQHRVKFFDGSEKEIKEITISDLS